MKRITFTILFASVFGAFAQAAPVPTITLLPLSGSVAGGPGSVVGFGFTLTNTSSDYVLLTGSQFIASPVNGTYLDYLSLATAPLYVAGPSPESSTVTQAFNSSFQLGLGAFDLNKTAQPGATITGTIMIDYQLFSQDPNSPTFDPNSFIASGSVSDPASVNVSPEPASLMLMSAALLPFAFAGWRRRAAWVS